MDWTEIIDFVVGLVLMTITVVSVVYGGLTLITAVIG